MAGLAKGKTTVSGQIDVEVKDYLKKYAKKHRWSVSTLVAVLLERGVEQLKAEEIQDAEKAA